MKRAKFHAFRIVVGNCLRCIIQSRKHQQKKKNQKNKKKKTYFSPTGHIFIDIQAGSTSFTKVREFQQSTEI